MKINIKGKSKFVPVFLTEPHAMGV